MRNPTKNMAGDIQESGPKIVQCPCGTSFQQRTIELWGKTIFSGTYCAFCCEKQEADQQARIDQENFRVLSNRWETFCPSAYRDTDEFDSRLDQRAVVSANSWDTESSRGIAFVGTSGKGKTRCMSLAVKRAFFTGTWCRWMSHNQFSKLVIDAFSGSDDLRRDSRKKLDELGTVGLVFLDDLGKAPSTERADAELEELIETRTANKKPILWTANAGGAWLAKRFGADRGEPIVRRLAEFCDVEVIR